MNRSRVLSLIGLLVSLGSTGCLALGSIPLSFNGGTPLVDRPEGLASLVTRNLGPRRDYEAIFGVYFLQNPASLSVFQIPSGAFDASNPGQQPLSTSFQQILGGPAPSSVGGMLHVGDRLYVGLNEPLPGGTFRARVHSIDVGKAFWHPLTAGLGYTLTTPPAGSEEIISMTNGPHGADANTVLVASARRVSADCHTPILTKLFDDKSLIRGGFRLAYDPVFQDLVNFTQCHTRTGQVRVAEYAAFDPQAAREILAAAGWRCRETPTASEQACLYSIRDDGTALSRNTGFGGDGQVILRAANSATPLRYFDHVVDAQGKVTVGFGLGNPDGTFRPFLTRLNADGTPDASFGELQILTSGTSTTIRRISIDRLGSLQVSGETFTPTSIKPFVFFFTKLDTSPNTYTPQLFEYTFANHPNSAFFNHVRNPDGTLTMVGASWSNFPNPASMQPLIVKIEGPPVAQPAIQNFHAQFGHYVTVVDPAEQDKLDTGVFQGWQRTGQYFHVYPLGTPGTTGVDRFFSTTFQKSSHFFTANAAESAIVKQNPNWAFEGTVFGVLLPDASGRCPTSTRPVARLYNNGLTGAPNHWFGDDPDEIALRIGEGSVLETPAYLCTE